MVGAGRRLASSVIKEMVYKWEDGNFLFMKSVIVEL